jgi:carboxyl-terminal processing protease
VLLGRTSFGKGSAQGVFATSSGGAVKITTARWHTPSGRSIDRPRDPNGDDLQADTARARFRTAAGRTVLGGGGIVPDITAGDTSLSPAEQALDDALGTRAIEFRDAMVDVAIQLKTGNAIVSKDFAVTPPMLDALWAAMRRRNLTFDRPVFDGAAPLVSRLLAREIARYVFGPEAEAERSIRDDAVIQAAVRLAAGAGSPRDLLERAQRRAPGTRRP